MNKETYIINTEYFLQCHGHCQGCFLSEIERQSSQVYHSQISSGLKEIHDKYYQKADLLVIGFGRGNILNLTKNNRESFKDLILWCSEKFKYNDILFEISTSLIGKIDDQIEVALEMLSWHHKIYFNIVIDSEITSKQFWVNLKKFYNATSTWRINNRKMQEDWGDILVLNINPQKLPNLEFIKNFTSEFPSPVNINMFPFTEDLKNITSLQLSELNKWSLEMFDALKNKDLNIKNYLHRLSNLDISNIEDLFNYQKENRGAYQFVDKNGLITQGMPSIMGEIDFPRLIDKYGIDTDFEKAYKKMQKHKVCSQCEYQTQCIASGSYINFLINHQRIEDKNICPSGYQLIFKSNEEAL